MNANLVLLIHCPDREGLIAGVTMLIRRLRGNVVDLDQHVDADRGVFFMRVAWTPPAGDPGHAEQFQQSFAAEVAVPCAMTWRLERADRRARMALFVSRHGHCLYDILARWESGEWRWTSR